MSEYWKSNPRKFCDFCKCWIADNKPSVEFHERGKRHKENVQVRLAEMGKKGQEDFEAKQNEQDYLNQMEKAALKAYKSDIEQNPDMTGNQISEIAASKNAKIVLTDKKDDKKEDKKGPGVKKWNEAKSPEGYTYYWNVETNESRWETPDEPFLSISEQEKLASKAESKESISEQEKPPTRPKSSKVRSVATSANSIKISKPVVIKPAVISSAAIPCGPKQKGKQYSGWKAVPTEEPKPIDLQLPQIEDDTYYGPELSFKQEEVTFETKTVTLSAKDRGFGGNIGFKKKRKGADEHKKNARQRTNDL